MIDRLAEVRQRRTELVARAAGEREEVGRLVGAIAAPLRAANWLSAAWRVARSRPVLIAGAVAAVVVLRPSRALAWSLRLWAGWQTFQRLRERAVTLFGSTRGAAVATPADRKAVRPER